MHIEVDSVVAWRFEQIGVFHIEAIVPLIFGISSPTFVSACGGVVAQPRRQLVRRNAGDFVACAIKGREFRVIGRNGRGSVVWQLLRIVRVDLIVVDISRRKPEARA